MSMDRLRRILAGGTLAITLGMVAASTGCRSTGNEIPPQPKYGPQTENPSAVGFNSAPHGYNGMGNMYGGSQMPGQTGMPGGAGPGAGGLSAGSPADGLPPNIGNAAGSSFGTPTPNQGNMGQPTGNAYGSPGTSGVYGGAGGASGATPFGGGGGGLGGAGGSGIGGR
jgi:hypothetical protein